MPSSMHGHGRPSRYSLGFARVEFHYLAGLSPARRWPSMHKKQGFALPKPDPVPHRGGGVLAAMEVLKVARYRANAEGCRRLSCLDPKTQE